MKLKFAQMEEIVKKIGDSINDGDRNAYPGVDIANINLGVIDRYHQGEHQIKFRQKKFENAADKIFFGYEAEKVDVVATGSIGLRGVKEKLKKVGFRVERDSSLDATYSYELISPIYSMSSLFNFLKDCSTPEIKRLLDASHTAKCGGHITLSSAIEGVNGSELAEMIFPYMPLLYAMYPDRTRNHYCQAKKKYNYVLNPEKYSALYVKGNLCEIRLFPAIKNTANLYWRVRLLKAMLVSQAGFNEVQVMESLVNKKSALYQVLSEVYSDEKIAVKANQFMVLARKYNNIVFQPSQIEKFKKQINNNTCPALEDSVTEVMA